MNKERILELADIIEKQPHTSIASLSGFNMSRFEHNCGSPACIGGWSNHLFGDGKRDTSPAAGEHLGINWRQADALFFPDDFGLLYDEITPAHAAAVLRHLAETGKVDWSVGAPVEVVDA